MTTSTERVVDKVLKYGTVFTEVYGFSHLETSKTLTPSSWTHSQSLSSVLPASHLRFVLAIGIIRQWGDTWPCRFWRNKTNTTRSPHPFWIGCSAFHFLQTRLQMKLSAKRQKSWRKSSHECSKWCKQSLGFCVTMSNIISGHILDWANADHFSARIVSGPVCLEEIKEMDRELTKVIKDFDHAVNIKALHLAKENGKYTWCKGLGILHYIKFPFIITNHFLFLHK